MRVSEDRLLDGRVILRQPVAGYRVAIDPVLLAAAVPARGGDRVLDLGCGVGAAALCLSCRVPGATVHAVDREAALVRLASENARLNDFDARFLAVAGDILSLPEELAPESYDHVLCNPPYHRADAARASPDALRAAANVEAGATLGDWVGAAARMARPGGSLTFVHRADRLDELLACLQDVAGDAAVLPIWSRSAKNGKPAKRVIVRAWKGRKGGCRRLPGLVLHESDGRYSDAAEAVLRHAQALPL